MRRNTARDMTYIAVCVALMAICAWLVIPSSPPFTMQTLAIFLTIGLLGGRRGSIATAVYLLLGAVGLPVFSGFQGGFGVLLGANGGYLIGFLFTALAMWALERLGVRLSVSMVLGLLLCYAFGTAWYMGFYLSGGSGNLMAVLGICVLPFILPDLGKIALALFLIRRLKPLTP